MVRQAETLARLRKEKDYEDKLAVDLYTYLLSSLDAIPDMTPHEKGIVRTNLTFIMTESERHAYFFQRLLEMVLRNGESDY